MGVILPGGRDVFGDTKQDVPTDLEFVSLGGHSQVAFISMLLFGSRCAPLLSCLYRILSTW